MKSNKRRFIGQSYLDGSKELLDDFKNECMIPKQDKKVQQTLYGPW